MAAHPPHVQQDDRDNAQDTPDSPRRADQTVRSACCGRLCGTRPGDSSSLSHDRRLGPPPRRERAAKHRDTTRRRAELTSDGRDAERRGAQGAPAGTTSQASAGPHNKWPLTRRAASTTTGTERRIRRAARGALTSPCGRLCCGRLCGTRPGRPSSLSHSPAPRPGAEARARGEAPRLAEAPRQG